jgi:hypothetical protein
MSNDLGIDRSGNGNNWTVNNITYSDQVVDSPTNNFATLNPLWQDSSITLQEGNLRSSRNANMNRPSFSTISLGTGKWYFEALDQYTTGNQIGVEWEGEDVETYVHNSGTKAYTWNSSGSTYAEGVYDGGGSAGTVASGARIRMVAYDGATGKLWGGANGTWGSSGNPAAGTNESMTVPAAYRDKMHFVVATENSSTSQGIVANFGQDSSFAGLKTAQGNQDGNNIGDFYYTPPTGFLALCTSNLPDVAVTPSEHFNTVLYNGSASTPLAVTGVGFSPDMTWLKARSQGWGTGAFTRLNGTGAGSGYKYMFTNTTAAESDQWGAITFDSDGFTGVSSGYNGSFAHDFGGDGQTFVSWNWKANGSGSSNTNGSINSTVSANVDAGFSIINFQGNQTAGATVGHGLSKAPEMLIIKNRDTAGYGWLFGHEVISWEKYLVLNTSAAEADQTSIWNDTAPTSTVFSLGSDTFGNKTGDDIICYAFHSVDGYSKVGSYTGNGNADGTFVYTGFKPMLVLRRRTANAEDWHISDSRRSTFNVMDDTLKPNSSGAESTDSAWSIDFLSNGFKVRNSFSGLNASGEEYIYYAVAETPFKYSNAR